MDDGRCEELAAQLDRMAEQLGDLVIDQLRRAADPEDPGAPEALSLERRLTRARRAVDKASALLRGPREDFGD